MTDQITYTVSISKDDAGASGEVTVHTAEGYEIEVTAEGETITEVCDELNGGLEEGFDEFEKQLQEEKESPQDVSIDEYEELEEAYEELENKYNKVSGDYSKLLNKYCKLLQKQQAGPKYNYSTNSYNISDLLNYKKDNPSDLEKYIYSLVSRL